MNSKEISKERKYASHNIKDSIHTGNMLKAYFKAKRIHKNALARHLNRGISTLVNFQKNSTIQTAILWEISVVLKHNFFNDIASLLPPEFTTNAPKETLKDETIATLQHLVESLTTERDILLKVLGK